MIPNDSMARCLCPPTMIEGQSVWPREYWRSDNISGYQGKIVYRHCRFHFTFLNNLPWERSQVWSCQDGQANLLKGPCKERTSHQPWNDTLPAIWGKLILQLQSSLLVTTALVNISLQPHERMWAKTAQLRCSQIPAHRNHKR